jgi:hypothetical protein
MTDRELVLVPAKESRGAGLWAHDDYDVRLGEANGRVVGKIFKAVMVPAGEALIEICLCALVKRR